MTKEGNKGGGKREEKEVMERKANWNQESKERGEEKRGGRGEGPEKTKPISLRAANTGKIHNRTTTPPKYNMNWMINQTFTKL